MTETNQLELPPMDDQTYGELNRLFEAFRVCELNVRYYGHWAEYYETRQRIMLIGVAILSFAALAILSTDMLLAYRWLAVIALAVATIASGVAPFLGWADKERDASFLHRSYGQLQAQVRSVMTQIRRTGELQPEQAGAAALALDTMSRLQAADNRSTDRKLLDEIDKGVRSTYPPDYLWTNV